MVDDLGVLEEEVTGLDDFDFDEELGLDEDGFSEDEEKRYTKTHIEKAVRKRLEKERNKQQLLYNQFQEVYGMKPEDVIEHGRQEVIRAQNQLNTPEAFSQVQDPVVRKIAEHDTRLDAFETRRQRELEAMEFLQRYPGVKFSDIPQSVLQRRSCGGVSLTEAYRLVMADNEIDAAARKASASTAQNMRSRERTRSEGPEYSGSGADATKFLSDEEREFAKDAFGMSAKEFLAYQEKVNKAKEKR